MWQAKRLAKKSEGRRGSVTESITEQHAPEQLDELGGKPRDRGSGEPAATSEFAHAERFVGGGDELKEEERALDRGRR